MRNSIFKSHFFCWCERPFCLNNIRHRWQQSVLGWCKYTFNLSSSTWYWRFVGIWSIHLVGTAREEITAVRPRLGRPHSGADNCSLNSIHMVNMARDTDLNDMCSLFMCGCNPLMKKSVYNVELMAKLTVIRVISCSHTHIHTHAHIHPHAHAHVHTHTHARTRSHTPTHTHTHT